MLTARSTSVIMGANENGATGEYVQWISFRIPEGRYAVLMSDIGWKDGTPVLVDDEHAILISAVYPVKHTSKAAGIYWQEAIRDGARIKRIIEEGMHHELPLREFFLMICDWIARGWLNDKAVR